MVWSNIFWICRLVGMIPSSLRAESLDNGLLTLRPQKLLISSFFHGDEIVVHAIVPSDQEVALRIAGPQENIEVMEKGRVWGLWMNTQAVTFNHIPKVYLLWTSKRLSDLAGEDVIKGLKMDYASLVSDSLETQDPQRKSFLIKELIKLKEHDGLYQIREGSLAIKPYRQGVSNQIEAHLPLPARIYPDSYYLELITFHQGEVTLQQRESLEVSLSGFPDQMYRWATQKGLLYGILAVIFATLAGLIIGIIFTSKSAH